MFMKKNNGFTLIEIISVIIILGMLMILAVPAVTSIIGESRSSTYVTDANGFVESARNRVVSKTLYLGQDTQTTYYIPYVCIKDELEHRSPYDEWDNVYVAITYDDTNYSYYYTSNDAAKKGIYLAYEDLLAQELVVDEVDSISTSVTIGKRPNILVVGDDCEVSTAISVIPTCNIDDKGKLTKEDLINCEEEVDLNLDVTITYDSGFTGTGSCDGKNKTVKYNGTYGELCTPSKKGSTFIGWYTAKNEGIKINSTSKVTNKNPHTLYAHYGDKEYTVTYNNNGGSGCLSKKVFYGGEYGSLCTPEKTGKKFSGWFLDQELTSLVTESTIVTTDSDHQIYAKYIDKDDIEISYDTNGGTSCKSMIRKYGEEYGNLCKTEKSGYTFVGWFTKNDGGSEVTSKTVAIGNAVLYARWIPNDYTILLRENGAKATNKGYSITLSKMSTQDTAYRSALTTSNEFVFEALPNETYYVWSGKSSDQKTERIYSGISVKIEDNRPSSVINYYGLKLINGNGISKIKNGINTTTNMVYYLYNTPVPQDILIDATVKAGYTFTKWTKTAGVNLSKFTNTTKNQNIKMGEGNTTLKANAKYTAQVSITRKDIDTFEYSATNAYAFYVSTSSTTPVNSTAQSTFALDKWTTAKSTGNLSLVKGTYYVWARDEAGDISLNKATINSYEVTLRSKNSVMTTKYENSNGTKFTNTIKMLAGTTVYAVCSSNAGYNSPTITYAGNTVTNGGTFTPSSSSEIFCKSIPNKYTLDINPDFNKYGTNYNNGARVVSFDLKIVSEDGEVIYNKTGLQDYCEASGEYNATYYITNVTYKVGYSYNGYSLRNDNSEDTSNMPMITGNSTTFTFKHTNLGTMWFSIDTKPNIYVVTYNSNGGSNCSGSFNVTYNSNYGSLCTPSRSDHTFTGWYTKATNGSKIESGTTVTTAGNHTIYAHWHYNPPPDDGDDDDDDRGGGGGGSSSGGGGERRWNGGCFLSGTKVKVLDGYKDIVDIKVGDYVLSYNPETKENEYKPVINQYVLQEHEHDLYELTINGKILKVTGEHLFYIKRDNENLWLPSYKLIVGDEVMYSDKTYHTIDDISYKHEKRTVYNLNVLDNHNYYVTNDMILVHNDCIDA